MGPFLYVLLAFAVFVAAAAFILVRRAGDFRRLVAGGVETTGVVTDKLALGRPGGRRHAKHIRYAYQDASGREHRIRSQVTEGRFDEFGEGDPIAIVYAPDKPGVSAPKWLVDEAKAALAKRK
jgi:hypothetical protein